MEYVYFLEVAAEEKRSNQGLFKLIQELAVPEDRIFSDARNAERKGLAEVMDILKPEDILIIRSVLDLSETAEGTVSILFQIKEKKAELYSLEEAFLNGGCAYSIWVGMQALLHTYADRKKRSGYKKAVAEKRVGRPQKAEKAIEKAVSLYNETDLAVCEIEAVTGVSRTTLYKHIRHKRDDCEVCENDKIRV